MYDYCLDLHDLVETHIWEEKKLINMGILWRQQIRCHNEPMVQVQNPKLYIQRYVNIIIIPWAMDDTKSKLKWSNLKLIFFNTE